MVTPSNKRKTTKKKKASATNSFWFRRYVTKRHGVALVFVLVFAAIGVSMLLMTRAATNTGLVKNSQGKCLRNKDGRNVNNNPVVFYDCHDTWGSEKWTLSGGMLKNSMGKCLRNKDGVNRNNNPVVVYSCNSSWPSEKWTLTSSGFLKNSNGKCLRNKDGNSTNNVPMVIYDCRTTWGSQKWSIVAIDEDPGETPVGTWPSTPPAAICGSSTLNGGPTSAPAGAITVPAGNNSSVNFQLDNKTYWFAPGTHTLGTDQFDQIIPGDNSTFVGAPGAILDGQNANNYAFTGKSTPVYIRYLTIKNFKAPRDEGVVNHDAGTGWRVEYNTITNNKGAGLMAGSDNIYSYNCIKDNGQYAINACCGGDTDATDIQNWTLDHNEITGNNTDDWESQIEGCGCTGGVKFWLNKNVTVTNNWVHHNKGAGLWLDNNNRGFIIENNYINDNDAQAIFAEAGYDFRIRYNNIQRNAITEGRVFANRSDPFPIGSIYVSESGSPSGYGIRFNPSLISDNNFVDNWGGVNLWENPDRYSGSSAHTHVSGTIKIGTLYDDAACDGASDTIPGSVTDKFRCRWSTENIIIENNDFRINKAAIGGNCTVGSIYCGVNGIFSGYGTYPEFGAFVIPWRITFEQGNIFRNNHYYGDWKFAGWETSDRTGWNDWRAPAPSVPANKTTYSPPSTFGQDAGSTMQ